MFSPNRRSISRWLAIVSVCALSILMPHRITTQGSNGDTPFIDPLREAWPLDDVAFRHVYAQAQTQREAAARLVKFPDSVNTVTWLAQAGRTSDALDVLERVIARHPTRIIDGLEAVAPAVDLRLDYESQHETRLAGLLETARARLPELDRESAARLALLLGWLDSGRSFTLQQLADTYPGTLAARLAAVDNVHSQRNVSSELAEYDAIVLREGTNEVAAKARFAKATALVTRSADLARERGNTDPTEPWLDALAIIRDLESGRYPPGPWVNEAATRIASFSLYQKSISPANAARLIAALRLFIVEHQAMPADSYNPIAQLVTDTMPGLATLVPDGVGVMDRQFTDLGRELRDPAAALYLKALWLDSPPDRLQPKALPPRSPTHEADVRTLLASAAAAAPTSAHARLALARLADRESRDPASLDAAHAHFEEYLRRFGSGPDAGLAALRLGHVEQAQKRHGDAATRFAGVARANRNEPVTRVLGLAYAARASEDAGRFDAARDYYRDAATAWTPDLDETLGVTLPLAPTASLNDETLTRNRGEVSRAEVQRRRDELTRSLNARGGAEIERGRWLVSQSRAREAVPLLERLAKEQAGTPAGAEARRVLTTARLEAAIDLADVSNPAVDRAAALAELDAIAKEPASASAGIAGILGATLTKLQGRDAEAGARMTASLRQWAASSARTRTAVRPGSLESDVLAVRDVVGADWNRVETSVARRSFVIAPSDLRVKLMGSNAWTSLNVSRQLPGVTNVVFMTDDDMTYLTRAVSRIGGTNRRRPTGIMEVPNQPIGDAQTIIRWWNEFFRASPGHWAGFDIMTSPYFTTIKFTNAERTRAIVPVVTGYTGHDLILERLKGVWTVTDSANHWVQ